MNSGKRKMNELIGGADPKPENLQFDFFGNIHGSRHLASPNGPPAGSRHLASPNGPPAGSRHLASPNSHPASSRHLASPNGPPAGSPQSQVQQILNTAAARPGKPFSFTSLLMAKDEDPLDAEVKSQSEQVNQTILLHTDILRQALSGMLEKQHRAIQRAANERALQKLQQKETELQIRSTQNIELVRKAEHYMKEAERLQAKADHLEQTNASLKGWLDRTHGASLYGEMACEDTGSSTYDEPDGAVGSVRIGCKACGRRRATVMMWPCRHVCVCSRCEGTTRTCPICRTLKRTGIEIILPLD